MILPIHTYGMPVLRKKAATITRDYPGLEQLIDDMFETLPKADGVGLAAPQVGYAIRLFIIDAAPMEEDDETLKDFKKVFINPQIMEEWGEEWAFEEGCLSVPGYRDEVRRKSNLRIRYLDRDFVEHTEEYDGLKARIIQHEYDHTQGILFVDRLNPLRKKLIRGRLNNITKGKVEVKYKAKFAG
ncbi:MAG: peptide deformylase [Bacteroidota bacterium]